VGEVVINVDNETNKVVNETHGLTLKTRTESITRLPTKSKGHGIIFKREIISGVYLAESLTREVNGYCITSIVNMLGEDVIIDPPHVELVEVEDDYDDTVFLFSNSVIEDSSRLSKLRDS